MPCPGCGGLRATNLLSRGELEAAVSSNLLAVVLIVGASVGWLVWFTRRLRGVDAPYLTWSSRSITIAGVLIFAFWVLRITPWGAGLAP